MLPVNPQNRPHSKKEAYALQEIISSQVKIQPLSGDPVLIAAVEATYGFGGNILYCCAVLMSFPELEEVAAVFEQGEVGWNYEPGLLYFREGPVIEATLSRLKQKPDVLIIHGHGIAHPRRCGLACHIGVTFDLPTIGCSRKLLAGRYYDLPVAKGSSRPVIIDSSGVGVAYRSRENVKPIFISPGHLTDIESSLALIKRCLRGFRQPEPLRLAHVLANKFRRSSERESKKNASSCSETT